MRSILGAIGLIVIGIIAAVTAASTGHAGVIHATDVTTPGAAVAAGGTAVIPRAH